MKDIRPSQRAYAAVRRLARKAARTDHWMRRRSTTSLPTTWTLTIRVKSASDTAIHGERHAIGKSFTATRSPRLWTSKRNASDPSHSRIATTASIWSCLTPSGTNGRSEPDSGPPSGITPPPLDQTREQDMATKHYTCREYADLKRRIKIQEREACAVRRDGRRLHRALQRRVRRHRGRLLQLQSGKPHTPEARAIGLRHAAGNQEEGTSHDRLRPVDARDDRPCLRAQQSHRLGRRHAEVDRFHP